MTFLNTIIAKATRLTTSVVLAAGLGAASMTAAHAQDVTLRGASMFDDNHAFTKTMRKFAELVNENYAGEVEFDLRLNGELGVEKDYVNFLQQGVAIDYTIMAPSNMAKFAPAIPLMDMPFLFRDLEHWNKVLASDALALLRPSWKQTLTSRLSAIQAAACATLPQARQLQTLMIWQATRCA